MDVVDTRSDVTGVGLVLEDPQELSIRLGVLNGENIGVKGSNGVEEVLELRVTEVRVDLGVVLDTSGGKTESLDGPVKVGLTLLSGTERETLTESGLVDLDDVDTGSLEIDDLVTESKSELLSLDGLVNVITGERPPQAGDRTSEHTLHGLLGDGSGVLGLLDGHGKRPGDVTDDNWGTDTTRSVRLDPTEGGEDVTGQTLTKVLDHVVTLRLSVDKDVEVKGLLLLDNELDLLLNETLILLGGDITLGELLTGDTDLLGLGERSNGGGGEERKVEVSLLTRNTGLKGSETVIHLRGDLGLALLDSGVVGAGRGGTRVHGGGVGIKLSADGLSTLSDGLGNDNNLNSLLGGE